MLLYLYKYFNIHSDIKMNLFTLLTKFLVITMPFYVLIKVFFEFELGITYFGLGIKEWVVMILGFSLIYEYIKAKDIPKIDTLDATILAYIFYWLGITLYQWLWLDHIFYGGRYDFLFLIVFLIYRHGGKYITADIKQIFQLGVWSMTMSIFISFLIKFRLGEETLLYVGFTDYVSNWTYNGWVPNYHGLENSGIKRFSGILESPNSMGFFLILFASLFTHLQKKKSEFYVGFFLLFILWLVFLTYSRSALLGIITGSGLLILLNLKTLYKYHKKALLYLIIGWLIVTWITGYIFQEKVKHVVLRSSSTTGHFERMWIGVDRFLEAPFGHGLATAGPAFRSVIDTEVITKEIEEYYIPESWFIQQMIEWWMIYFLLFVFMCITILMRLYSISPSFFTGFMAIIIMNVFLHSFEATYLSVLLFLYIWLLLKK